MAGQQVLLRSFVDVPSSHAYRCEALQDLAVFDARSDDPTDFSRYNGVFALHTTDEGAATGDDRIGSDELDALLALSKAALWINNGEKARQRSLQLSPWLSQAHRQDFTPSSALRHNLPSPWEQLTFQLTRAIIVMGTRHLDLLKGVTQTAIQYIQNCNSTLSSLSLPTVISSDDDVEQCTQALRAASSLLGFLEAITVHILLWHKEEQALTDLVQVMLATFSERNMELVDGAARMIRASESKGSLWEWRFYMSNYSSSKQPLSTAFLFKRFAAFLVAASSVLIVPPFQLTGTTTLELLTSEKELLESSSRGASTLIRLITRHANSALENIESCTVESLEHQDLLFVSKAHCLHALINCMSLEKEVARPELLLSWLERTMADTSSMSNEVLAAVVLSSLPVVAKYSSTIVPSLSRSLPRFIVQSGISGGTVDVAARTLTYTLRLISQDALITGIYTLGNVLTVTSKSEWPTRNHIVPNGGLEAIKLNTQQSQLSTAHSTGSVISLNLSDEEETSAAHGNVVRAVVCIALSCHDEKIAALAQSMLLQKLGRVSPAVDIHILREASKLALGSSITEFKSLLKLYNRIGHEAVKSVNHTNISAVKNARMQMAKELPHTSPLYQVYLVDLLETVISKGDVHESKNTHTEDVDLAAREIIELVYPLATLASVETDGGDVSNNEYVARLHREAWFNVVVHGITPSSEHGKRCRAELRLLATKSKALIAESRGDQFESEIELNTVLRRGMNGPNTAEQKKRLIKLLPQHETDIRTLSYPKVVFLISTYLLETLRAEAGDCSHVLTYFLDPSLNGTAMENCTSGVAQEVMAVYLAQALDGSSTVATAPQVAVQLASMFQGCCHRMPRVQQVAAQSADKIISQLPSALCHRSSLFALLELLTIMWTSCLAIELDEYELRTDYSSTLGNVSVQLSDDYDLRRATLNNLYKRAKAWITHVINIAPLAIKGLLQTYLSDFDDDGTYGHMALGRSFALDMGSVIPAANHKLAATERHGSCNINTASDFIAQYTSRQEYKYADSLPVGRPSWDDDDFPSLLSRGSAASSSTAFEESRRLLESLEARAREGKSIALSELRDSLRRAAALLCKSTLDSSPLLRALVDIPLAIFSKHSVRLGISVWLNIINERPIMESKVLALVAEGWERSIRDCAGAFGGKLRHQDPFNMKEEYAATDKDALSKKQTAASNLIAPHLSLLQFLMSHFAASRLGSPHTQRIYHRLIMLTLEKLRVTGSHPLAREFHFQVVLFGLNVFRYCTGIDQECRWLLKDAILSAGLAWFQNPPRWSFGGNRLQVKAELRLMADIEAALQSIASFCDRSQRSLRSLSMKQELLVVLLENEQNRLLVWLHPLDHERRRLLPTLHSRQGPPEALLSQVLPEAWYENPRLALYLATRFPSARLYNEIRAFILKHPDKLVEEPDALQILIGAAMPLDVSTQLKQLLYWAPVNPVTAVTYFLPEFNNDPYIIQYAMRALESHSVDVTFFYVPQIVQTLRYDVLGYVQRYILETAKVSQLFAHQILWNMKANSYKDEDSKIEDTLKPTLDIIKARMIESFSGKDKEFYEREFSFFDEITGISGKLRPYIKKTKPEKKQKIEEELRQIKVDVGVYLPSNPEGTVIGIDRKSGKPLQSHAKAPYMATFRIKKSPIMSEEDEDTENLVQNGTVTQSQSRHTERKGGSYEVWQSAIFKVGDDCRQDVLALQMIAVFRGIFNDVGLDVFVYPNRVTATAPGCGVIDVLPNSISRDMLGREAINGLYEYFVSCYGAENSIAFQEARNSFVKSMAAYSVISYLLQFKDRHNGNIMIDKAGHILHIDFGFCFDIAPGGVRFERAPFKLTSEMVAVMGGNTTSQPFKWFEELCIKAFLASRPHTEKLCHLVVLMLGSGLPCFKPETIKHLRERFVLEKSEREAADFMRDLIKKSYSSYSTKGYDQFQLLTNGIPY